MDGNLDGAQQTRMMRDARSRRVVPESTPKGAESQSCTLHKSITLSKRSAAELEDIANASNVARRMLQQNSDNVSDDDVTVNAANAAATGSSIGTDVEQWEWEWDPAAAAGDAHINTLLEQQSVFGRPVYIDDDGSGPVIEARNNDSPYVLSCLAKLDLRKLVRLNRFHLGPQLTARKGCRLRRGTPLYLTSMAQQLAAASSSDDESYGNVEECAGMERTHSPVLSGDKETDDDAFCTQQIAKNTCGAGPIPHHTSSQPRTPEERTCDPAMHGDKETNDDIAFSGGKIVDEDPTDCTNVGEGDEGSSPKLCHPEPIANIPEKRTRRKSRPLLRFDPTEELLREERLRRQLWGSAENATRVHWVQCWLCHRWHTLDGSCFSHGWPAKIPFICAKNTWQAGAGICRPPPSPAQLATRKVRERAASKRRHRAAQARARKCARVDAASSKPRKRCKPQHRRVQKNATQRRAQTSKGHAGVREALDSNRSAPPAALQQAHRNVVAECPVCFDVCTLAQLPCKHMVCAACTNTIAEHHGRRLRGRAALSCPLCRRCVTSRAVPIAAAVPRVGSRVAAKYMVDGQARDFEAVIVSTRTSAAGSNCTDAVVVPPTMLYTVRFDDGQAAEIKRNHFKLLDSKI